MEIAGRYRDMERLITQSLISSTSHTNLTSVQPPENSVTNVLNYCKSKILNPYVRLLSIAGLRPLMSDRPQPPGFGRELINYFYLVQSVLCLILGYFLQFMSCFRRDRGFCYKTIITEDTFLLEVEQLKRDYEKICHGPIFWSFIIPSFLHLVGYLYAVCVIRPSDDDQLPVLVERVFLSSTSLAIGATHQKKLVRTLWIFVSLAAIWVILSLLVVSFMVLNGSVSFKWLENSPEFVIIVLKVLLIITTIWQDIVQTTIMANYCLQVQFLTVYLQFLREKLLQYPVVPLDWMRHIEDFKKILKYINNKISPSVCIFTVMNLCFGLSGLLWLFNYDSMDKETAPIVGISVLNITLWIVIALVPFIQAAKLSNGCAILRNTGQEARVRPLVHQNTPSYELDSILLYTTSLKLRAKLFCIPITLKYLCLFFVFASIVILVLGQCHFLNLH